MKRSTSLATLIAVIVGFSAESTRAGEWIEPPSVAYKRPIQILDDQTYGEFAEPDHRWLGEFYAPFVSRSENDGYVKSRLVLAEDGSVASATAVEAIGLTATESDALLSLEHWRFKSGTGKNLERVLVFRYRGGSNIRIGNAYLTAVKQLQSEDLDGFAKTISKLKRKANSLYAASRIALLDAKYALLTQDKKRESANLAFLARIGEAFLEPPQAQLVFRRQFAYQLEAGHLAAAMDTFSKIEISADESDANLVQLAEKVRLIKTGSEPIASDATLNYSDPDWPFPKLGYRKYTGYQYRLLRYTFGIEAPDGGVETVAVRCERGLMDIDISGLQRVAVPPDWGECMLYIDGVAGTRFRITEYP